MNAAIIRKTVRDCAGIYLRMLQAVIVFELLFIRAMGEFSQEMSQLWLQQPMVRRMIQMLIGYDLATDLTPTSLMTIGLAHPLLFAFTWTFVIAITTRVLAGEVDRGTADLLLSLPVSRTQVYASVSIVWLFLGIPLNLGPLLGMWLGQRYFPLWKPIELQKLWYPTINLMCLYICIGCIATLYSSIAIRRGIAIGISMATVLFSLVIMFLAQFWRLPPAVMKLSLLNYYRPLLVIRSHEWPVRDMAVLLGVGLTAWIAGAIWFARRDVPAA